MLCSSSQFCFHYAHATIPIMLKRIAHDLYSETLGSIYGTSQNPLANQACKPSKLYLYDSLESEVKTFVGKAKDKLDLVDSDLGSELLMYIINYFSSDCVNIRLIITIITIIALPSLPQEHRDFS